MSVYQLLKIKFEKMRDDHFKQIDELKDKTNHTDQIDEIISTSPVTKTTFMSKERITLNSIFRHQQLINVIIEPILILRVNGKC